MGRQWNFYLVSTSISLLVASSSLGQVLNFTGGNGRGDLTSNSSQIFLSGLKAEAGFKGGIGGGSFVLSTNEINLNGINSVIVFSGGNGSGSVSNNISNTFLNGETAIINYSGGVGSGNNFVAIGLGSLNGISTISPFNPEGGLGRGDSYSSSTSSSLSGNSLVIFFNGGGGLGSTSVLTSQILLTGQNVGVNFNGGIGRGDFYSNSSQLISLGGIPFVVRFPGGNGRGEISFKSNAIRLNGVPAVGLRMATTKIFGLRAEKVKDNVHLDWSASNSNNIRKFEVESSLNGNDFYFLGEIQKDQLIDDFNFSFDYESGSKSNYYRVVAENQDLSIVVSDVVKVKSLDNIDQILIVPNPAKDVLGISFSSDLVEEDKKIIVYDLSGKIVKNVSNNISSSSVSLNIEDLKPGIFLLEVISKSFSKRMKFVKE
jgi:hypothetical protein